MRTETAKYVTYPGHPEWTEVFDLKADPYEIKNLAADASSAELRSKLEAEFEKQKKAVDFVEHEETKSGILGTSRRLGARISFRQG